MGWTWGEWVGMLIPGKVQSVFPEDPNTMETTRESVVEPSRFWPPDLAFPQLNWQIEKRNQWNRLVRTHLPNGRPGVYTFSDESGRPIYIGKAKCLRSRLQSYSLSRPTGDSPTKPIKENQILVEAKSVSITPCLDELGALVCERDLISRWKPKWNKAHKFPPRRWLWLVTSSHPTNPFQMKAKIPKEGVDRVGPFRGGKFTTLLKLALNQDIPGCSITNRAELAKRFVQGKDRSLIRVWEKFLSQKKERIGETSQHENPEGEGLSRWDAIHQALVRFEKWRVKVAQAKTLTGIFPIPTAGLLAWNLPLNPCLAYFYILNEGRIVGVQYGKRLENQREGNHANKEIVTSPGWDEPILVASWLERFPACAQSFVFAQTTPISNSVDLT